MIQRAKTFKLVCHMLCELIYLLLNSEHAKIDSDFTHELFSKLLSHHHLTYQNFVKAIFQHETKSQPQNINQTVTNGTKTTRNNNREPIQNKRCFIFDSFPACATSLLVRIITHNFISMHGFSPDFSCTLTDLFLLHHEYEYLV